MRTGRLSSGSADSATVPLRQVWTLCKVSDVAGSLTRARMQFCRAKTDARRSRSRAPWLFQFGEWVPMQIQKALRHLLSTEFWLHGKWFFLSIVIGIVAGLGAIVFQFLSQAVLWATLGCGAGYWPGETAGEFARFPKK